VNAPETDRSNRADDDAAKKRFAIISLVRLSSAVLVMLGLLVVNRNIAWPIPVGYVLVVIGLVELFLLPLVLARRWRSPPR